MRTNHLSYITDSGEVKVSRTEQEIRVIPLTGTKLGIMMVGLGGNNGTTFAAGIKAYQKDLTWENKHGKNKVEFLGSLSQVGSVHIGYDKHGKPHSKLFKEMSSMYDPSSIVVGGWDINNRDLYTAARAAQVIPLPLLEQLREDLSSIVPLPSVFNQKFIASNQSDRANNVLQMDGLREIVDALSADIATFKKTNELDKVIVMWTASTECFNIGKWVTGDELLTAITENDPEVPPSILFAVAAIESGCIFINGSPQNTLIPPVIDLARRHKTFVGGEDFKTGQTKLKSALVDWLVSSGIKPLSIVSYNHLGNNDGKNLSEEPQFKSKEITKRNVIDDVVEANPVLFSDGHPDHTVVIKYVPAVQDSKRAMDEYYSKLFLDGRHTIVIHNTCEDSLLAVPIMLDIALFADLLSRIQVKEEEDFTHLNTVLSTLSFFFKAPTTNGSEPVINAFFKQRHGLENLFRVIAGLPSLDHITLPL